MYLFPKGFFLGISMAAPVGPIAILCIRRTLSHGFMMGLATGLGAATADGLYALIAALGISSISQFLTAQTRWLELIGGIFLMYLGLKTLISRPVIQVSNIKKRSFTTIFLQSFFLTLANPMTLIALTVIFAGLGINTNAGYISALELALSVSLGSLFWFSGLAGIISLCRSRCTPDVFSWFHTISALLLVAFGTGLLGKSAFAWL